LIRLLLIIIFLLAAGACKNKSGNEAQRSGAVARAYDTYLLKEDLEGVVPAGIHGQDSINLVRNFINNWVRQQVILKSAEDNLDDEKKDVEKKLREYRNSLLTYAYERELVAQQLDTVVSAKEIEDFYNNNQGNFELKDNIIKVLYLKLNKNSPKMAKVKDWVKSEDPRDRRLLTEYATQYALNYFLDDQTWLFFEDLLKEIPIRTYDQEQFLRNNRNIEIEDSSMVYLVSIKGFKIKDSLSPLSFETANIRNMIINQRKLKLIEKMEASAYEEAGKKGHIEIY
jgi:hypothetical protein